jgi:hypothetical protein
MIDLKNLFSPVYANDNDAYVPEIWANEALIQLEANMVAAQLVHQDFSNQVARFGDTVNTRRPQAFNARLKQQGSSITKQDAISPNVAIVLNRHIHVSFEIFDQEDSLSFQSLIDNYITPAARAMANMIDEIVLGTMYEFIGSSAGQLGAGMSKATLIDAKKILDDNLVPFDGRWVVLGSCGYNGLLNVSELVTADKVGDDGTALRRGSLGRLFDLDIVMDQNAPTINDLGNTVLGAVNDAAGYAKNATTMTVDGFTAAILDGSWFTVAGDNTPQRVISTVGGATPTSITFTPGLKNAVADDAVITIVDPALVNFGAGYAAGYSLPLVIDTTSVAPQKGQLMSHLGNHYSAIDDGLLSLTSVSLNRTLQSAAADDDVMGMGPAGSYGFAFHRNAVALVMRPLAAPRARNVEAFVASYNGVSMRITISYDHDIQSSVVTLDLLAGVKVLDPRLGCIIYS